LVSDVISQAAPTLCMNAPISEIRFVARRFRNVAFRRGCQGPDGRETAD
jgi:hypothetical protein